MYDTQEAGLQDKLSTRIGGILAGGITIKGLSNGEKRRLAVVCAAIANPSILFLDGARFVRLMIAWVSPPPPPPPPLSLTDSLANERKT